MPRCNLYDTSAALIWSLSDYGGVVPDILWIPAGTSATYSYPWLAGRTIWFEDYIATQTVAAGQAVNHATISYPSGVPTISVPASDVPMALIVWGS